MSSLILIINTFKKAIKGCDSMRPSLSSSIPIKLRNHIVKVAKLQYSISPLTMHTRNQAKNSYEQTKTITNNISLPASFSVRVATWTFSEASATTPPSQAGTQRKYGNSVSPFGCRLPVSGLNPALLGASFAFVGAATMLGTVAGWHEVTLRSSVTSGSKMV